MNGADPNPVAATDSQNREELHRALDKIKAQQAELDKLKELLAKAQDNLFYIYPSNGWKILVRYYKIRNWLLPWGSWRHKLAGAMFGPALRLVKWVGKLPQRRKPPLMNREYARWLDLYGLKPVELQQQRQMRLPNEPTISLVADFDAMRSAHTAAFVQSVLSQTYANWELCLAGQDHVLHRQWPFQDGRIRISNSEVHQAM